MFFMFLVVATIAISVFIILFVFLAIYLAQELAKSENTIFRLPKSAKQKKKDAQLIAELKEKQERISKERSLIGQGQGQHLRR